MDLSKLESFAVDARRELMRGVADKIVFALQENSPVRRQNPQAVKELEAEIKKVGKDAVIEKTAYAWFNRFCALRFMDVNGYTDSGVVTPPLGGTIPGILAEARDGNFDEGLFATGVKERVRNILTGVTREDDPNSAAYRVLFIATCNSWQSKMPFLFEKLGDWTELLLPDDLLSANSILAKVRAALTSEVCADVEVVGWLYQFYVSEKKSAIEEGFSKNVKASAENIPAVTQLFTPHWIVKYLVQNSLGRLWLTLHPESSLKSIMEYYVPGDPAHPTPVPTGIERPEDIRICDPCCGSAHMLIYAFDILYFIYEECGYSPAEIPGLILKYNLFGLELDPRAASLSSFALVMKARSRSSRFLRNPVTPNICTLRAVKFESDEIKDYMDCIGRDLFTVPFATTLGQFEEADNFGSLIVPELESAADIEPIFAAKNLDNDLLHYATHQKVLAVLHQAAFLASRYHVVVTNPPYLGLKNANSRLRVFAEDHYPNSKSDLFSMFIERCSMLTRPNGCVGMITMQSWMFLASYEKLRESMLSSLTIATMMHLGARAFDTISGEVVSTTSFVLLNRCIPDFRGGYLRLIDGKNEQAKEAELRDQLQTGRLFRASSSEYNKIPGKPIAYWVSPAIQRCFERFQSIETYVDSSVGLQTGNNDKFIHMWWEIVNGNIKFNAQTYKDSFQGKRYFPYNKGGTFRRWHGNNECVVVWQNDGEEIRRNAEETGHHWQQYSDALKFRPMVTWSRISSGSAAFRYKPAGFMSDMAGFSIYPHVIEDIFAMLGFANSKASGEFLSFLSPTVNFMLGQILTLPYDHSESIRTTVTPVVKRIIELSEQDYRRYETSWDYSVCPLLRPGVTCSESYKQIRSTWKNQCEEMYSLEKKNNSIFIDAYGLQDQLKPEVPWHEITLTCNPWYRYGKTAPMIEGQTGMPTDTDLEARLKTDTVKELISYAVGCMMGRYSLEKPGLILADQGATEADYYAKVGIDKSAAKFKVDEDGIIPILDNDWFADDIVTRFKDFIKVAFGEEHYLENMSWIEDALGKDIRSYFTKDLYKDHLQRYQNRPIYWLFQSPKGAFRALVYMHRYKPDMVGGVLGYLRSLQTKIDNQLGVAMQIGMDESKSASERVRANKDAVKYAKSKKELDEYERNVLYPLSTERIEIDLDDGVKANYRKFGAALRKVAALEGKGE